jgi:putative ABC transport system permease protein
MKFRSQSRGERQAELRQEIESHLQLAARDSIERGESPAQAENTAYRQFGNVALVEQTTRDQWGWRWLDDLLQDLRYGLRMLRKNSAFTLVAVLTLALGIGANTAIFSVINAVILRPLPFASPDRLVWLNGKFPMGDLAAVSPPDFREYRVANRTFEKFAALGFGGNPSNLAGDKPEQVLKSIASAEFFGTLGLQPLLGRDFVLADEDVQLPQVAILGNGIWKRDFGGDPRIVGRTIRLDGQDLTVIGILPTDVPLLSEAEIWLPMPMRAAGMNMRLAHFLKVIGRLKPGVTLEQSLAETDAIARRLAAQYPDTDKGWSLRQRPLAEFLIGPVKPALLLISAAVGLLLLIACVNVANLLLARSIARHREFSVRAALGAGRGRVIRQTLTESVVLALLGGVLGILGAIYGVHALRAIGPADLPRLQEIRISGEGLAFTAGLSLLTGILFGLAPALQVSAGAFTLGLKETGRTSASGTHKRLGGALVVCEIAVSLALLVGAGLLLKSFWRLIHVNPGFQTAHVITTRLSLNAPIYNDEARRVQFWEQLEQRVATLPGVEAVGATSELPLTGEHSDCPFYLPDRSYGPSEFDDANCRQVTPGYLATMRIPLLAGRWFDVGDSAASPKVMLVNQAFLRRYFKDNDVLGKQLKVLEDRPISREIVGIVGTITHDALSDLQAPEMYLPYAQSSPPTMRMVVRATADPQNLAAALRELVSSIDKDETLSAVRSMDDVLESSVAQPRFSSQLLGLFAGLAVLLSAIGLYGLMAYSVTQRVNELGIRVALGATRWDILRLILKHGSALTFTGIGIGLIASLAAARLLSNLLFSVAPSDPVTFIAVALLLAIVALAACYIPARRAMRVDPMVALRYE